MTAAVQLETLDTMSREWNETLDHLEAAVAQHVYQEESDWFVELDRSLAADERSRIEQRYREEFERYCGSGNDGTGGFTVSRESQAVHPLGTRT